MSLQLDLWTDLPPDATASIELSDMPAGHAMNLLASQRVRSSAFDAQAATSMPRVGTWRRNLAPAITPAGRRIRPRRLPEVVCAARLRRASRLSPPADRGPPAAVRPSGFLLQNTPGPVTDSAL